MCKYKEINKKYIYIIYIERVQKNTKKMNYPIVTLWLPYGYLMVRVLLGYCEVTVIARASFVYHSCIVRVSFVYCS